MNIYKFELKMLRTSIIIWASAIAGGLIFYMLFYPLMADSSGAMEAILANYPEEFLAFFGMNNALPFTSVLGYYGLTYSFVLIPVAIQASNYGFHILSVEERELTADFLLTKPVSRKKIIISKFSAATTSLLITNITVWIASFVSIAIFAEGNEIAYDKVAILLSSLLFFQLFFISVGMFISVLLKKIPSVLPYSMGLGFGMFIISSLGEMLSSNIFKLLSPYSHFEPVYILINGSYRWGYVSISIIITIMSLVASYFLYLRRNIASV